jgi:hypothetical protein
MQYERRSVCLCGICKGSGRRAKEGWRLSSIVFVHGTGVREMAYSKTFDKFHAETLKIRADVSVVRCYWGGSCGSRLRAEGQSIPAGRAAPRSTAAQTARSPLPPRTWATDEAEEDMPWSILELDSLFELKLMAVTERGAGGLPPGAPPPSELVPEVAEKIAADEAVRERVADAGLDEVFGLAVAEVFADKSVSAVLSRGPAYDEVWPAMARSVVAKSLILADGDSGGSFPIDGVTRDALVGDILSALGGSPRGGVGASLGQMGLGVALRLGAMTPVERRRDVITRATSPMAGDVAMYLARGDGIRDYIGTTIQSASPPVAVVAHSLGGVAVLELLGTRQFPQVELLVTVGSQAPLLYELNALPTLSFGTPLPASVPRWVNVFDRRDLLAFIGEKIFPGRVTDRAVENGVAFPRAHSAYFANREFYAVLDEVMP